MSRYKKSKKPNIINNLRDYRGIMNVTFLIIGILEKKRGMKRIKYLKTEQYYHKTSIVMVSSYMPAVRNCDAAISA